MTGASRPIVTSPCACLKSGFRTGASLEIWAAYFPKAEKIVGCDINPACANLTYDDPRIAVVVGDANSDDAQERILSHSSSFDLVIDDGSHTSGDIVRSFSRYFPKVTSGGTYIAEDLHCSYWESHEGGLYHPHSSIAFFKSLVDVLNREHWGVDLSASQFLAGFQHTASASLSEEMLGQIHSIEFFNSGCSVGKSTNVNDGLGPRFIAGNTEDVMPGHLRLNGERLASPDQSANAWAVMSASPAEQYRDLRQSLADKEAALSQIERELASLRGERKNLRSALAETDAAVANLTVALRERDHEIAAIRQTLLWKLAHPMGTLRAWRATRSESNR